MVYICEPMKLYIDGCILHFMDGVNATRYVFTHTVSSEEDIINNFKVICDAPIVSSPYEGITMKTNNIELIFGDFKEEYKNFTFPYGSMFGTDRGKISFMIKDEEGSNHWYSYSPIREELRTKIKNARKNKLFR